MRLTLTHTHTPRHPTIEARFRQRHEVCYENFLRFAFVVAWLCDKDNKSVWIMSTRAERRRREEQGSTGCHVAFLELFLVLMTLCFCVCQSQSKQFDVFLMPTGDYRQQRLDDDALCCLLRYSNDKWHREETEKELPAKCWPHHWVD